MSDTKTPPPREVSLEVLRSARVLALGGEGPEPGPTSTWFVLHGYRQLARRFIRRFRAVASPGRRVVAPEALSRFYLEVGEGRHGEGDRVGASWMTREDREREIVDYVRYLDRVARDFPEPARVGGGSSTKGHRTVLGFSQGAHTAARWMGLGSARADRLVLWGAGFPRDLPPHAAGRLRELEVVLVRGAEDGSRHREDEKSEEAQLEDWGVDWRSLRHPGGHEIDEGVLDDLVRAES